MTEPMHFLLCLGIYWIQNIISAVVYRAFRGYFLNSIVKSILRRRIAVRASFEILRERYSHDGFVETRYAERFVSVSHLFVHLLP